MEIGKADKGADEEGKGVVIGNLTLGRIKRLAVPMQADDGAEIVAEITGGICNRGHQRPALKAVQLAGIVFESIREWAPALNSKSHRCSAHEW